MRGGEGGGGFLSDFFPFSGEFWIHVYSEI